MKRVLPVEGFNFSPRPVSIAQALPRKGRDTAKWHDCRDSNFEKSHGNNSLGGKFDDLKIGFQK